MEHATFGCWGGRVLPQADELRKAFDGLPMAKSPAFGQLVQRGRLRFAGTSEGVCDLIDDYTSRLICECISSRRNLLVIWPDQGERRVPLALATAVVCDSILGMGADAGRRRILYVGGDSTIREQFASVRVGGTALAGVFAQEFGRGDSELRRQGPDSSLPVVTTILSPAEPGEIIRTLRPRWIAVDCGCGRVPPWLPKLLAAAHAAKVAVIGWTDQHISPVAQAWRATGGSVYRWPKAGVNSSRFASIESLYTAISSSEVTPLILAGDSIDRLAAQLALCYQLLARHADRPNGQLQRDAMSVAWRYLRLLESVPVPIEIYEVECLTSWGMPALSKLKGSLERFVQALKGDTALRGDLGSALEQLSAVHESLGALADPPLWSAAANLAIDAKVPSRLVFPNRAFRDMFRFSLLGRFNIAEDDLRELGVTLGALSDRGPKDSAGDSGASPVDHTLIGMPSRMAEWRLEQLFEHKQLRFAIWPHLEGTLRRRCANWALQLSGQIEGPLPIPLPVSASVSFNGSAEPSHLRVGLRRAVQAGSKSGQEDHSSSGLRRPLWDRHDAADAIVALFDANVGEDDPTTNVAPLATALEDSGSGATTQNEEWIEEALCVVMDDGSQILLPVDDRVNVITRSADGVAIVQRFCRSLRVGEELLLVNGEHRRSLYDLLLSRVHRHPTIAPWLSLIEKWHDGLRRAFQEAKQRSGMTLESLLALLRARGSTITTGASVRGWVTGITLAPSDPHDIRRLGELFGLPIAMQYSREIRNAASRLKGLHINLSGRLNRWLESEGAGAAALSSDQSVVDAELGLTIDDFRHSLVRGRIASVDLVQGPFLSSHLGVLQRSVG